jgi:hypothetical protein
MQSNEKPHLIIAGGKGEPTAYHCSLRPDDRSPKEAAAELWAAFQEHVGEEHAEEAKD